jgi:hypothetical protein
MLRLPRPQGLFHTRVVRMAGMKPRFALRDLFWLMLAVGLAVGWWMDRSILSSAIKKLSSHARRDHHEIVYWQATEVHIRPK